MHSTRIVSPAISAAPGVTFRVVLPADATDPNAKAMAAGVYPPTCSALFDMLIDLGRGARVLDLGGYVGGFSLAAAAAGYDVVTVEASPQNAALLESSVEENGFTQMRVVHAAVSDRDGSLEFCAGGPWGHVKSADATQPAIRVEALTVETILARVGWSHVDFIKMDVEGSEVAAIRGMRDVLRRSQLPPILYEANGFTLGLFGHAPAAIMSELAEIGYLNHLVDGSTLRPLAAPWFQPSCLVDCVATAGRPAGLRAHKMGRPLSRGAIRRRMLASLQSANPAVRRYAAGALAYAPDELRHDAAVVSAAHALLRDPDEGIQRAAQALELPRRRRSIAGRFLDFCHAR